MEGLKWTYSQSVTLDSCIQLNPCSHLHTMFYWLFLQDISSFVPEHSLERRKKFSAFEERVKKGTWNEKQHTLQTDITFQPVVVETAKKETFHDSIIWIATERSCQKRNLSHRQFKLLGQRGLSTWKYHFAYGHWSQAMLSSVSTRKGDSRSSVAWVLLLAREHIRWPLNQSLPSPGVKSVELAIVNNSRLPLPPGEKQQQLC